MRQSPGEATPDPPLTLLEEMETARAAAADEEAVTRWAAASLEETFGEAGREAVSDTATTTPDSEPVAGTDADAEVRPTTGTMSAVGGRAAGKRPRASARMARPGPLRRALHRQYSAGGGDAAAGGNDANGLGSAEGHGTRQSPTGGSTQRHAGPADSGGGPRALGLEGGNGGGGGDGDDSSESDEADAHWRRRRRAE
jgi:hypothetical protein